LYAMATAGHREPCDSRGSCTVLGAPGGESPPGDSPSAPLGEVRSRVRSTSDSGSIAASQRADVQGQRPTFSHMAATSKRQEFGVIKGQPMWSTREELEAVLDQAGLGEWSPRLAAAARHAIILEPGPVEEDADAPIGASRLGGMPDLPSRVPWP